MPGVYTIEHFWRGQRTRMDSGMSLHLFHPVIQDWFHSRFAEPTEPQEQGWPAIAAGGHTLIAAPTGSGKTLTAFLAVIDRLFREGLEAAARRRAARGLRLAAAGAVERHAPQSRSAAGGDLQPRPSSRD